MQSCSCQLKTSIAPVMGEDQDRRRTRRSAGPRAGSIHAANMILRAAMARTSRSRMRSGRPRLGAPKAVSGVLERQDHGRRHGPAPERRTMAGGAPRAPRCPRQHRRGP